MTKPAEATLGDISTWLATNKLVVNISKTNYIILRQKANHIIGTSAI